MLKYHDDTFQRFPRRTADIHPNLNVFEEFPMPGPTRAEWALIIGFALFAITVLGVLAWYFLG